MNTATPDTATPDTATPDTATPDTATLDTADPRSWVRRLLASAARHRGLLLGATVTALLATGLVALPPLILRLGLNDALAGRTDRLLLLGGALGGAALVVFAGTFARQYLASRLALSVQHDLRTEVFSSLQRLDGAKQDSLRTGQVMSRANIDLQMVQGLLGQAPSAVGSVVLIVVSFAAMLWLSPLLTLVPAAMVAVSAAITVVSTRRLSPATWAVQHRNAVLAQIVTETVSGAYVVKGFGQEEREVSRFADVGRQLFGERMRVARMQSQPMATLQSLPLLAQVGVLVLGGYLAITGRISLGDFVAFAAFTTTLTAPAGMLSNLVVLAQLSKPAVERVYDLLDTHPSVTDAPDAVDVPDGPLGVVLDGVTFGYVTDEPVLSDVSLTVAPGETVAVVGPSGSGKSTLALMLPRFYDPLSGSVRVLSSGVETDVRALRTASLRRRVGVVFEEPFLFASSITDNISYGHPDAAAEEIERAARAAGAAEFIDAMPKGYATEVGERGSNLSGGQRQRIALARTLLANPSVLVLDDATSAVDAATAADIQQALASVSAERTTILIAHRRATLALADRIVVMDRGSVVDTGTEQELLERCHLFAELFAEAERPELPTSADLRVGADGTTAELWPAIPTLDLASKDGPDEVALDGMTVDRQQARDVAALPAPVGRPADRLAAEPPSGTPPPRGLFAILRPVSGLVVVSVLLMAGDAAVTSAVPALIQRGMDTGVTRRDLGAVWTVSLVLLGLIAANWLVLFWQPRFITRTGESAMFSMRVRSFRHIHSLGLEHFEQERSGQLLTRMTTDVASLAEFVETGLTIAVVNILTVLVMAAAMVVIDLRLALAAFTVLPVLLVATLIFRRLSRLAYEQTRERIGEVNSDLQESLEGLRTNQSHGREAGAEQKFGGLSAALRSIRLKAQSYAAAYFPFITLLSDAAMVIVLVVGVRGVAAGTLTPGVLTAFILYLGLFFAPFSQLSTVFDGYQRAKVGANQIADLLSTPALVASPDDPVAIGDRLHGDVELAGVGFSYAGSDRPALADVSLTVPAGSRVALVGETGSGKSTLVKLVARLYDVTDGTLSVDGRNVRDYDLTAFRRRLGVAPQEAHLFSGSVADNIRYARPEASDADVQAAATTVGALPMIATLPRGFGHQVGEHGKGLSTGQAQLIALARVQLADPDIAILDEPTASLDAVAERAVLSAMEQVAAARTTFLVTHRLASAARSDDVVVLDGGRVIEHGTHQELLARGGRYAELWELDRAVSGGDSSESEAEVDDSDAPHDGADDNVLTASVKRFAFVTAALVQLIAVARRLLVTSTRRRTPPGP